MKFTAVPPFHIDDVWPIVEPMLQKAIDANPGLYHTIDLKAELIDGAQVLWVMYDGNSIEAAATTRVTQYPRGRTLTVEWVGGSRMDEWLEVSLETIELYAADMKCNRIEVFGRKGWKVLKKYGWQDAAVIYRKEIE